jgi:maltose O-acetyltransferase
MLRTIIYRILKFLIGYIGKENRSALFSILRGSYQNSRYDIFRRNYNIHESFQFNGDDIVFYGRGLIILGEGSYIGSYSTIQSDVGRKVSIGKGCHISHNVRIYTTTNIADQPFDVKEKNNSSGDVIIEDFVWIGANVLIVPNITIGKNSVIGANSVVSKSIASNSIWAGAPIKLIKEKTIKI